MSCQVNRHGRQAIPIQDGIERLNVQSRHGVTCPSFGVGRSTCPQCLGWSGWDTFACQSDDNDKPPSSVMHGRRVFDVGRSSFNCVQREYRISNKEYPMSKGKGQGIGRDESRHGVIGSSSVHPFISSLVHPPIRLTTHDDSSNKR